MYCGKPIAKFTDIVWVRREGDGHAGLDRHVFGPLYSKAQCQAKVNEVVVSVSYWNKREGEAKPRVAHFGIWDGESWADEFFCSGPCCRKAAYNWARTIKFNHQQS
jgi:hypothetical protein